MSNEMNLSILEKGPEIKYLNYEDFTCHVLQARNALRKLIQERMTTLFDGNGTEARIAFDNLVLLSYINLDGFEESCCEIFNVLTKKKLPKHCLFWAEHYCAILQIVVHTLENNDCTNAIFA